jgi:hypothetical protein
MSALQNDPKNPKEVHMEITPTGSMTAAKSAVVSCSVCTTWIANTARSAGNAVNAGAAKVTALVSTAFQALAKYASAMAGHTRNFAVATMNALKANPQIAMGGLVVLLAAAAIYAYRQRAAAAN